MGGARVLITGGFGSVGAHAVETAVAFGHEVHVLDVGSNEARRTEARLARRLRFTTHWADLRDADAVNRAVAAARPDAIVHIAAVIAPVAYVQPALARAVNVDGTRNLVEAATRLPDPPRFVFTSSYAVHGPRNPHRDLPPLTGDTPLAPADNYGRHKVLGETAVRESGLPFAILRLPAVLATDLGWGQAPPFLKFFTLLDPDRREHLLDARDAALALVRAIDADVVGRALDLGGPEVDCRVTGATNHAETIQVRGLRPFPTHWFRRCDPEVDAAWFYEDFVDTAPSQALLRYQEHRFEDHLAFMRHQLGFRATVTRWIRPLAERQIFKASPYYGRPPTLDRRSMWAATCDAFGLDPDTD